MSNVAIYQKRLSLGLCQYCGNQPHNGKSKGCDDCQKKRYEKYKSRPYSLPQKQTNYRRKIRLEVLKKYGDKCVCCGEAHWELLTIDHINRDGGIERRQLYGAQTGSGHRYYLKLKRDPIRSDLRVLCMSCNWSIGQYGYCPHKKIS